MTELSGDKLLKRISNSHPEINTVVVNDLDELEAVVRCMKLGSHEYFVKADAPDLPDNSLRPVGARETRLGYPEKLRRGDPFADIVTGDPAMLAVFSYVEAVAVSPQPLLITGESGVGKELVAQAAHRLSGCRGKLVTVNVAGLDDTVFADTLFGHLRGAYTGAETKRRGMVEEAAEGTLFLDEIGDLSMASQVKLLRLLEGQFFPIGSDEPRQVRARLIFATHRDLACREAQGTFRRDLFYRLRTHHVHIPPLRERPGDIPLLLEHFLAEAANALGKEKPLLPPEVPRSLAGYSFPGNVRELRSMIYDAVSVNSGDVLHLEGFAKTARRGKPHAAREAGEAVPENPFSGFPELPSFSDAAGFLIAEALDRSGGNQTLAARLLGISQPALSKRIGRLKREERGAREVAREHKTMP